MQGEIVHDDVTANASTRTVRVSELYKDVSVRELYAFFTSYGVQLSKITDDKKPHQFRITADEMNTLADTWIKFQEDSIAAREAKEKRQAEVKAAAVKIVEECPIIKVEARDDAYNRHIWWEIRVVEVYFYKEAYSPDELLEYVTDARKQCQVHFDTIAQAQQLAKENGISITQNDHPNTTQKSWHVGIPSLEWKYSHRADNAQELLGSVQYAVDFLHRSQTQETAK